MPARPRTRPVPVAAPDVKPAAIPLRPVEPGIVATPDAQAEEATAGWAVFRALDDANFRWFFGALMGTFAAMNMQMFIRGWLVFELTGSHEALVIMTAVGGAAGLVLAPLGGVVADRMRQRKRVVQACQLVNALVALGVGVLLARGELTFNHLIVAAFVQGGAMNVMMPSRQALTPEVVGMRRLMNAIALNAAGMNVARLLMPGLAGWLVGALGSGSDIASAQWVYYLMVALYIWATLGLERVGVPDRPLADGPPHPALRELWHGLRYVLKAPTLRLLLGVNFFMVFFGMTYFMLLPGFAKQVLDAGPTELGILTSVSGVGALIGSLLVASMTNRRRGTRLLDSALLLGVALVLFGWSTSFWLSAGLLVAIGLGSAGRMSLSNVLVQGSVSDEYRGRVMSIYMLEFAIMGISMYPIGLLADAYGPRLAVGLSGAALVLLALGLRLGSRTYRELD